VKVLNLTMASLLTREDHQNLGSSLDPFVPRRTLARTPPKSTSTALHSRSGRDCGVQADSDTYQKTHDEPRQKTASWAGVGHTKILQFLVKAILANMVVVPFLSDMISEPASDQDVSTLRLPLHTATQPELSNYSFALCPPWTSHMSVDGDAEQQQGTCVTHHAEYSSSGVPINDLEPLTVEHDGWWMKGFFLMAAGGAFRLRSMVL